MNEEATRAFDVEIEFSQSITKISKALVLAQGAMGGAIKGKDNPFFHSKYADLAEIIAVVKEPLNDNGVCFMQPVVGSAEKSVRVATIFLHESGEWMKASASFPAIKSDPQAFGSAVSYARRYCLQSFMSIPSEDDDGNKASGKKESVASVAMTQDFPPNTPLVGLLKQIIEADGTKPAIAMIEMDGVGTLGFDLLKGHEQYKPLLNRMVEFQYGKNGKFRPITEMYLAPTAPQAPLKAVPPPARSTPPKPAAQPPAPADDDDLQARQEAFAAQYTRGVVEKVVVSKGGNGPAVTFTIACDELGVVRMGCWHSPETLMVQSFEEYEAQDVYFRYTERPAKKPGMPPFYNIEEMCPADVFERYCKEQTQAREDEVLA